MKISKAILMLSALFLFISCTKEDVNQEENGPSNFSLLFISNNATEVSFTPTFTWQESTDVNGGDVTYEIYIQKSNELSEGDLPSKLVKSGITTNTYTVTQPLLASTQYKWYVKAVANSGGKTNSNKVFSFMTAATQNLPPNPFDLVSPFNNETDVPSDPILTWEVSSDPENDPVTYDVYLGVTIPDTRIGTGVQGTSLPVGSLQPNTTYSWYVQAKDNAGNGRNSSVFYFTTEDSSSSGSGGFNKIKNVAIPLQDGRRGHQMVNYDDKIWIIGGFVINSDGSGGEYNDVWNSSDGGNTWDLVKENTPELGFVRSEEHQAVVFNNEIWVINGNRNTAHKSTDGITWENVPFAGMVSEGTHYAPRHQFQVVVFYDRLYLIGGSASGIVQNDVWSTNGIPNGDGEVEWILDTADAGFEPRQGHQAVVFKDKIYVVGGSIAGGQRMNDIWSSHNGVNWSLEVAEGPFTERTEHVLQVQSDGDIMWLLGGNGIDPNTGNSVDSLNDAWVTNDGVTWYEESPHNANDTGSDDFRGRQEFDTVANDGEIILFGGKSGTTLLNDVWGIENF